MQIEHIAFDLSEVFHNVASILALSAESKGLELIFRIDPDLPLSLVGDPLRLGQVLLNLVGNAIKFTEAGEILVVAGCVRRDASSIELRFDVRDSGIGISEEQRPCLFRSFSQADQSTTRRYGGTGLGLAICKMLTEAMAGKIDVDSQPGRGSSFTFTAVLGCNSEAPSLRQSCPDLSGVRVLIVEGNDTLRAVLGDLLEACAMKVAKFRTDSEALAWLQTSFGQNGLPADLILMNNKQVVTNGVDAVRKTNLQAGLKTAPSVVLMMNRSDDDATLSAGDLGVDAVMIKPIEPSLLLDTIASVFDGQDLVHAVASTGRSLVTLRVSELHVLMAELDALLRENNVAAEASMQHLREVLEGRGFDDALETLEQAIDRLDYPGARMMLASLVSACVTA